MRERAGSGGWTAGASRPVSVRWAVRGVTDPIVRAAPAAFAGQASLIVTVTGVPVSTVRLTVQRRS
ncbi:hypothetical protein GCM10010377_74280 [Streptomyces viridiviolaceus]|nr:hypothetical protein GCM10010377_74280 [Streptomyces viridiviolaceus]